MPVRETAGPGARGAGVKARAALALVAWAFAGIAAGGPKLACDQSVFDFGEKNETDTVEHAFRVRNDGDAPLDLLETRISCGCLSGRLSERRLEPGAETDVTVTFRLKGRSGPQHQRLYLRSTDPDRREILLTMVGRVRTDLSLRPPMVFFGNLSAGAERTTVAEVLVATHRTIRIVGVSCPAAWVEAVREDREGGGEQIRLRTRPPLPLGLLHTTVEIRTDARDLPVVKLPVGAYVRPESELGSGGPE